MLFIILNIFGMLIRPLYTNIHLNPAISDQIKNTPAQHKDEKEFLNQNIHSKNSFNKSVFDNENNKYFENFFFIFDYYFMIFFLVFLILVFLILLLKLILMIYKKYSEERIKDEIRLRKAFVFNKK